MGLIQEFKEFAVKGNAVDMAVGIILGAAFTKVVNSLVADILMPPLGMALGGTDFKHLQFTLRQRVVDAATGVELRPEVAIKYGLFVNTLIDFAIVALAMFVVIKMMNRLIRKREATVAAA